MKIAGSDHIKPGCYALIRDGAVNVVGPIASMSDHYRPGDTLVVSVDAFEHLREIIPLAETPHPPARGRENGDG